MKQENKKKYTLKGIDCPSCAAKLEENLKKSLLDETISINFTTKTIKIKPEQLEDATRIIKRFFPEGTLIEEEDKDIHESKFELIKIVVSLVVFALCLSFKPKLSSYPILEYTFFLIPYFLLSYSVILKSISNLKNKNIFDENFLILIATIGSIAIRQLPEAVAVMLFYSIGEYLQESALNKSRKYIKKILNIKPKTVTILKGSNYLIVSPEEVKIGDIIVVKPGEKIPLDGVVIEGDSFVDTSALTGESIPKRVSKGDDILSGMLNESNLLKIKVAKEYKDSTIAKILELVEEASSRKSKTEKFITKFARYYTPSVVLLAILIAIIPPIILPGDSFAKWIYRSLVLLVISCPCALVISIPLSYFAGIGKCAKEGILVKGSNYLEALTESKIVAFDKTGTLTKGKFKITKIVPNSSIEKRDVLKYASYAEVNSNHPIAKTIVKTFDNPIDKTKISYFKEIKGVGVETIVDGKMVLVGNDNFMHIKNIPHDICDVDGTVVYVAVDGKFLGYILIEDEIKPESLEVVKRLKEVGIEKVLMFTGDNVNIAKKIAKKLNIDEFYADLLPQDKAKKLMEIKEKTTRKVIFAGDGINDAPVIALSDVGIAMGNIGSDAAIEAADVVIINDNPLDVPKAIRISKYTKKVAKQNIVFSIGVKLIFITLGIFGLATMWEAVFADVGVTLIAVLNSLKVFRFLPMKK